MEFDEIKTDADARLDFRFRVSSGLKSIIGRDLINNDQVAIFELVKNSFDAGANNVELIFLKDTLYIIDDGKGMTDDELANKWLFVAYSAKRDGSENNIIDDAIKTNKIENDYRNRFKTNRSSFAGNKGIGRFSCDRLGGQLSLQTKSVIVESKAQIIKINWADFDVDSKSEFVEIDVYHESQDQLYFPVESKLNSPHGTIVQIDNLSSKWDREKLIRLKSSLAKLVNPLGTPDDMSIFIIAPDELDEDIKKGYGESSNGEIPTHYKNIINGLVSNPIFESLSISTTKIEVYREKDGSIISKLIDRGEVIYEIRQKQVCLSRYSLIQGSDIDLKIVVYYLNQAAKLNFTKKMGVQPVNFGNLFLFNNGFRVYPIGEPSDDSFGLDKRKAQGYARFLGTREILGRIDLVSSSNVFVEASSRDAGLIKNPIYDELITLLFNEVIRPLEAYVGGILWRIGQQESKSESLDFVKQSDQARETLSKILVRLVESDNVEIMAYSHDLMKIIDEKSRYYLNTLENIKEFAERTKNSDLQSYVLEAEVKYAELKHAEEQAKNEAKKQEEARLLAEAEANRARLAEKAAKEDAERHKKSKEVFEKKLEEERKRSWFLSSTNDFSHENLLNLHHHVRISALAIEQHLRNTQRKLDRGRVVSNDDIQTLIDRVGYEAKKIESVSRFATKANFRLESDEVDDDIIAYIVQYIEQISTMSFGDLYFAINTKNEDNLAFTTRFKPIELSMMIDNIIDNSKKHSAKNINFVFSKEKHGVVILISDDGSGVGEQVDRDMLFHKGYTTTSGSGLGLYHSSLIVQNIGGTISLLDDKEKSGFSIKIFISNKKE